MIGPRIRCLKRYAARDAGLDQIPTHLRDPVIHEFRRAVLSGLSDAHSARSSSPPTASAFSRT